MAHVIPEMTGGYYGDTELLWEKNRSAPKQRR